MRGWPSQKDGLDDGPDAGGVHGLVVVGGAGGHVDVGVEDAHRDSSRAGGQACRAVGGARGGRCGGAGWAGSRAGGQGQDVVQVVGYGAAGGGAFAA